MPRRIRTPGHVVPGPIRHRVRVVADGVFHAVVASIAAGLRATIVVIAAAGEVLVRRGDEVEADGVAGQGVRGVGHDGFTGPAWTQRGSQRPEILRLVVVIAEDVGERERAPPPRPSQVKDPALSSRIRQPPRQ